MYDLDEERKLEEQFRFRISLPPQLMCTSIPGARNLPSGLGRAYLEGIFEKEILVEPSVCWWRKNYPKKLDHCPGKRTRDYRSRWKTENLRLDKRECRRECKQEYGQGYR